MFCVLFRRGGYLCHRNKDVRNAELVQVFVLLIVLLLWEHKLVCRAVSFLAASVAESAYCSTLGCTIMWRLGLGVLEVRFGLTYLVTRALARSYLRAAASAVRYDRQPPLSARLWNTPRQAWLIKEAAKPAADVVA